MKNDYSAMVAHTLKGMWLEIIAWAEEAEAAEEREKLLEAIGEIKAEAERGHRLVQEILRYAEIGAQLAPVDLHDVVVEAARGMGLVEIRPFSRTVQADGDMLTVAIRDLLINATKYGEGKPITVSFADDRLCVRDNGRGVTTEEASAIFDKFRKFGGNRSSHGVGLFIVRNIVEAHGWNISIASEGRGKGASFCIHLK